MLTFLSQNNHRVDFPFSDNFKNKVKRIHLSKALRIKEV